MSFQNAVQQRRPERPGLTLEEYNQGHDYPYANILGPSANKSRRRLNWFNWFAAATFLLAVMEILLWP